MSMKFRCFLCFLTALLLISGCARKRRQASAEYEPSPSPKMSELALPSSPGEQVAVDSADWYKSITAIQASDICRPSFCTSLKKGCASHNQGQCRNIAYDFTKENEYETFPLSREAEHIW